MILPPTCEAPQYGTKNQSPYLLHSVSLKTFGSGRSQRMFSMTVLAHGSLLYPPAEWSKKSTSFSVSSMAFRGENRPVFVSGSFVASVFRIRSFKRHDGDNYAASNIDNVTDDQDNIRTDEIFENLNLQSGERSSFLAKLAIGIGVAATITVISLGFKKPSQGTPLGFHFLPDAASSSSSLMDSLPVGYTIKAFGYSIIIPEYAPGWVYFWLLMAAGCGLFISEEALNIWVGISLSRLLSLDGTWLSFAESFSKNAPYIISTVLWVYWGVCISDMIPFYLGKLFRQSGASDDICSKLGIGREKAASITRAVQRSGNLIGLVERFSLGVRNPTAFLAGALGISPDCFFAGVCCGGLITLPLQLAIGFLLRERPVFALATVATVVGVWTIFPYALAAMTALFIYLRRRHST